MLRDSLALVEPAASARPVYLVPVADLRYGSVVTRICGDAGSAIGIGGVWGRDARHHYSKDQPWNSVPNGDPLSMLVVNQKDATPDKIVLDGNTYRPLFTSDGTDARSKLLRMSHEFRWRPGHPTQAVSWIKSTQEIMVWDVMTGTVIWQLAIPSDDPDFGWLSEGTISHDGNTTVLATSYKDPRLTGLRDYVRVVDLAGQRVGPPSDVSMFTLKYENDANGLLGNVNISALGGYVMGKVEGVPEYGFILRVDPVTLAAVPQEMAVDALRSRDAAQDTSGFIACMSHADGGITPDGREVFVGGLREPGSANIPVTTKDGHVIAIDCATGRHTHIDSGSHQFGGDVAGDQHCSARCHLLPGWVLVTYASRVETTGQFIDSLVLWKLDGSRECRRLCETHTDDHSGPNYYRHEAHGCPSPDGSRAIFASNWQTEAEPVGSMEDVKAYVVSLAVEVIPPPVVVKRYSVDLGWTIMGAIIDNQTGRTVLPYEVATLLEELVVLRAAYADIMKRS